jgi:hypothetical protein
VCCLCGTRLAANNNGLVDSFLNNTRHQRFIRRAQRRFPHHELELAADTEIGVDDAVRLYRGAKLRRKAALAGLSPEQRQAAKEARTYMLVPLVMWMWLAYAHPCRLTGAPTACGVDRLDSDQPYTGANTIAVTTAANLAKRDWGDWPTCLCFLKAVRPHATPTPNPIFLTEMLNGQCVSVRSPDARVHAEPRRGC